MLTLYDEERSADTVSNGHDATVETVVRDIHEEPPEDNSRRRTLPPPPAFRGYFSPPRSTTTISEGAASGENFTTVSREFNALVIAGSSIENNEPAVSQREDERQHDLMRIREEETNLLAIVPDHIPSLDPVSENGSGHGDQDQGRVGITVERVKKEEVEAKITAWETAKLAKINNRYKREDAIINGWVTEQIHKANSWMKKIERKLEERKAKAIEKTKNKVAKAQRKAEERRATAERKRGTEVAKVVEVANLMRAVGRPPPKRSFFSFS